MDADPHAERRLGPLRALGVQAPKAFLHRQSAADGTLGVVGLGNRRAEVRHDAVAEVLVEGPTVGEDHVYHVLVVLLQQHHHVLAPQPLAERGEVAEIAEEHRHFAALAHRHAIAEFLQALRYPGSKVAAQPLALSLLDHDVLD